MATYLSLSALVASKAGHPDLIPNDLAEHFMRFTGAPRQGFRPRPLFEIFVPEYWEHNYGSGELIRDKIVIVGAEGKWQKDELNTPFGTMPGAEVHLNALNALLHGEFLKDLAPFPRGVVTFLAALVGFGLWARFGCPGCAWSRLGRSIALRHFVLFGFIIIKIFIFRALPRFWHLTRTFSFAWSRISHSYASRGPNFDQPCKRGTISPT